MSTVSREVVSEESSSYQDESELDLGLGLSLGGGKDKIMPPHMAARVGGTRDRYARILTAKDFPLLGSSTKDSSSSSSSASVTTAKSNGCCGTKRAADTSSLPGRSAVCRAVGWPPIPTHRMISSVNHLKSPATKELTLTVDKYSGKSNVVDKTKENQNAIENEPVKASLLVKVNINGFPIGRKVDLTVHSCYETLAYTLDDMFRPGVTDGARRSNSEEQVGIAGVRQPKRLLGGLSDFVLTYEDKDGDWMLVGDVPWEMFLRAVRRLRIMKTDEAKGLAPRSRDRNKRQLKMFSKNLEQTGASHLSTQARCTKNVDDPALHV